MTGKTKGHRATSKRKPPTANAPRKPVPKTKKKTKLDATTATRVTATTKRRALEIVRALSREHPDAHCELDFTNALELLVGSILAAQCTDARVNEVTRSLFKKYTRAQDYLDSPDDVLKEEIRSTGFFNNKTRSIKNACRTIVDRFGGEVPSTMDELLELGGVGRKTANVLLTNVFGVPGIVVDTHMLRLSKRMGFTQNTDPAKVELDLMAVLPDTEWIAFSHLVPWHGRRVCTARKPDCDGCAVSHVCPKLL